MINVRRHNDDVMWLAIFDVLRTCRMHVFFYNVLERAHQGELEPEKNLSISQTLNEIWYF